MRFARVTLEAPGERLDELRSFYVDDLGLELERGGGGGCAVAIGETVLEFEAAEGDPFYHFALLLPGNRFQAALKWIDARTRLLPGPDGPVFDFSNWRALACYFHDPAGNIVELISHTGFEDGVALGDFRPSELLGLSELGLVGDVSGMMAALDRDLGLSVWSGTLEMRERLAFVGERGRSLILSRAGRGWMPTGRPAVPHPLAVELAGARPGETRLEGSLYVVRCAA